MAVLIHISLSHRVLGQPVTPLTARAEWRELTDYAVSLGIHRHIALLIGDFNASMNTPHSRRFTARSKCVQERLLSSLKTAAKLVDIFPMLYPNSHHCTWWKT